MSSEIESLFASFSTFLSSEWTSTRRPYRFVESVRATLSAPSDNTSRIFLEHGGFKAWVAYFVVKPTTANASGQQAQRQLFTALDNLSAGERVSLAKKVASVRTHSTVENLIRSMEQQMTLTTKQPVAVTVPSKRRHIADPQTGHEYLVSPPYTSDCPQDDRRTCHNASDTDSTRRKQDITSGADIEGLELFPEYLRFAIRRDGAGDHKTAAVSMNFPSRTVADVDCAMTLEVLPNKVERLAMLLFDAHLETNGKVRELVLPGGTTAITNRLQGSRPKPVSDVFGPATAAAIEAAPYRRREVSEGIVATRCVSLSDFTESDKGGIITLTLGLTEGSQIYEKLFSKHT